MSNENHVLESGSTSFQGLNDAAEGKAANVVKVAVTSTNNADNNINGHQTFTWLGENQFSSSLFSQSSEYINGLVKSFDKMLTEKFDISAKGINLKIVKIDSTVLNDINGEFICFVMYADNDPNQLVGIHPLFIVDSKYKLQETPVNFNNSTYLMQHVHSELITIDSVNSIKNYIKKCVPFSNPEIAYAQTGVVFIDKVNNQDEVQITSLLANSAAACHSALREAQAKRQKAIIDIDLTKDAKIETLESTRTINNNVLLDSLGCPVNRTGFEVQFSAKRKVDVNNNNFVGDVNSIVSKPIALVHGYVDVKPYVDSNNTFVPNGTTFFSKVGAPQNNNQLLGYGNVVCKNYFVANIVLTNLAQLRNHSLGNQLMTLAVTVNNVINDEPGQGLFWADLLNPMNQVKNDMHSISGLKYEISTRENNLDDFSPLNVHSSKFDDEVFKVFMNEYFSPNASVSLLVVRNGTDSWKYKTFVDAAYENKEAIDLILKTASTLTNGKFDSIYKEMGGTSRPVFIGNNVSYYGTYYNQQLKQRRSLQDINFSYLLNMVDKKAQFFNDFVLPYVKATCGGEFYSGNQKGLEQAIRLALQKYVIENVASDVEILGIANEIVFEAVFIKALLKAIDDCGVKIENKSLVNKAIINSGNVSGYLANGFINGGVTNILNLSTINNTQRGIYSPIIY